MKYAVYILGPGDKGKKKDLVKDKGAAAMLKGAAAGALGDVLGVDFYDPVAKSLTDEKSVAISGKTITSMDYKTALSTSTRYHISDDEVTMEDVYKKTLKHTLTVKGVLEANNAMFGISGLKDLLKKKDLSRVWKWANTHFDADKKEYYRDVVAISYSTAQDRYRVLVMIDASVGSYEEYFDKDGIGHFTLVINRVIDSSTDPADMDKPVVGLGGPTFEISLTTGLSQISQAASTVKKVSDKGIEVAEKFGADTKSIEKAKKISKHYGRFADTFDDTAGKGKIDITTDNIGDQIKKLADTKKIEKDEATKTDTTEIKTETSKDDDGNDVITKTTTNPDGSKTIEVTTKDKKGNVISVETKKVKA